MICNLKTDLALKMMHLSLQELKQQTSKVPSNHKNSQQANVL